MSDLLEFPCQFTGTLPRGVYRAPFTTSTGVPFVLTITSNGVLVSLTAVPPCPQLRRKLVGHLHDFLETLDPLERAVAI